MSYPIHFFFFTCEKNRIINAKSTMYFQFFFFMNASYDAFKIASKETQYFYNKIVQKSLTRFFLIFIQF